MGVMADETPSLLLAVAKKAKIKMDFFHTLPEEIAFYGLSMIF